MIKYQYHYDTPVGRVRIEEYKKCISGLCMEKQNQCGKTNEEDISRSLLCSGVNQSGENCAVEEKETELLKEAHKQLMEYFEGKRKGFELPIYVEGTVFQEKVWKALQQIPYGETRNYEEIAKAVGSPKACRAVGGANHKNPIMIIIPCHRVIGKDGTLTGFGGGLAIKEYLLKLEKNEN